MEEDILNFSPTVMYHGTPCTYETTTRIALMIRIHLFLFSQIRMCFHYKALFIEKMEFNLYFDIFTKFGVVIKISSFTDNPVSVNSILVLKQWDTIFKEKIT